MLDSVGISQYSIIKKSYYIHLVCIQRSDKMYLFERPKHQRGIYAIVNIITKKVYVGLSKKMPDRQAQHLEAIIMGLDDKDNKNLVNEEIKEFWYFTLVKASNDEELSAILYAYESLYMNIFKEHGFELYNISKSKELETMKKELNEKYYLAKVDYDNGCALKEINKQLVKRFGHDIDELSSLKKEVSWDVWQKSVDKWRNNESWNDNGEIIIRKENIDYFFWDAYEFISDTKAILQRPRLQKSKIKESKIEYKTKSIFDKDLNFSKLAIISKYGSYGTDTPYDIILKKTLDLKKSKEEKGKAITYWGLRNFNGDHVRKMVESAGFDEEKPPIYAVLLSTGSKAWSKGELDFEHCKSIEQIEEEDRIIRENNECDVKNYYLSVNNEKKKSWIPLENVMAVTVPLSDAKHPKMSAALVISDLYLCEEQFDYKEFYKLFKSYMVNNYVNETIMTLKGSNNNSCVKLKKGYNLNQLSAIKSDMIDCIIAKLEWPYVVDIAHDKNQK